MDIAFGNHKLTPEQCIELLGRHCWKDSGQYLRHAMVGALREGMDICNHCGSIRRKFEQPTWRYEDESV